MRKFSKILTVLLTLALLCGVIMSVFASAADSTWTPKITEDSRNRYDDFDGLSTGNHWNNYRPNFASTSTVEGVNGNHYAQIIFPQTPRTAAQYAADTLYTSKIGRASGRERVCLSV